MVDVTAATGDATDETGDATGDATGGERGDATGDATTADELKERVRGLGATDEDRLDAVAERNDSLEERLPGDDELPLTKG